MTITPEMEKEIAAVRKRVRTIFSAKRSKRSGKSGKPLLIVMGEDHFLPKNLAYWKLSYIKRHVSWV